MVLVVIAVNWSSHAVEFCLPLQNADLTLLLWRESADEECTIEVVVWIALFVVMGMARPPPVKAVDDLGSLQSDVVDDLLQLLLLVFFEIFIVSERVGSEEDLRGVVSFVAEPDPAETLFLIFIRRCGTNEVVSPDDDVSDDVNGNDLGCSSATQAGGDRGV
jgi:hypothetical protein